jgi:ribonucleoside-diphosphate reductase beta chain
MTGESSLEAVRRVEEAPLNELAGVTVDQVEAQMDRLLEPDTDSASLYRRWERQQWAVADLDLAQDRLDWETLPSGVRHVMQHTMTLFFIGEQAVTDTLAPLLHAAPREDERIFLATQIADEARHTVFFQRFFEEVLGVGGGLHAALDAISPRATEGFRKIFEHQLRDATDLVRREPENERAWVEGIVTYHLMIEGYLAITGQRTLLRTLRNVNLMPGFRAGFTAVARDESRHIGFGVMALRRRVAADPATARVIALKVLELLDPAVRTVVSPDRKLPFEDPREIPEALRVDSIELKAFALTSLAKRLLAAGLSPAVVADIRAQAELLYETTWSEYESNHGVRHPVRFYQEGLATALP